MRTLTGLTSNTFAWWNSDWTIRKKFEIDTSTAGLPIADQIGTVAVLVRLHDGNFQFPDAKEDGSDIRFLAEDDKTLLAYHIEKYDALLNEGFVWVKLPDLKPGAKTSFWMYYGNGGSNATWVDDSKGTYDVNTTLVYHFAENNAPPHDLTTYANNAQGTAVPVAGALIGPGVRFDGQNRVTIPKSESLAGQMRARSPGRLGSSRSPRPNAIVFSRREGSNAFVVGADNGVPFVEVERCDGPERTQSLPAWHRTAGTTLLWLRLVPILRSISMGRTQRRSMPRCQH